MTIIGSTVHSAPQVAESAPGPRAGYLLGQRALPPGAGSGARRNRGAARPDARAPGGGSVRSRGCTRIPARLPGPFPRGHGAKGRLLPNNSDLHSRNNAGGEPRAAGREPESREAGSAAPPAREPTTYWRARVGGNATLGGEAIPRGKGTRPRGGRRTRGGEAGAHGRTAQRRPPAQLCSSSPVAVGKEAGATRPPPPAR